MRVVTSSNNHHAEFLHRSNVQPRSFNLLFINIYDILMRTTSKEIHKINHTLDIFTSKLRKHVMCFYTGNI